MKLAVFSDFDGTISMRDVGYSLFHHFSDGRNDDLLPAWKDGSMSTRDCLQAEADLIAASFEELLEFVDRIDIDQTFFKFVELCHKREMPLTVISDGLDFYIKHLLEKNNLGHLEYIANKAVINGRQMTVEFPIDNISCKSCGICKGEQLRKFREKHDHQYRIIFIGDGYSDACAAGEADILFAKKDLMEYCHNNNIDFYPYNNFDDVVQKLTQLGFIQAKE